MEDGCGWRGAEYRVTGKVRVAGWRGGDAVVFEGGN